MLRTFSAACTTVAMAAVAFTTADAHGYISSPQAQFIDPYATTKYVKTITADVNSAFAGLKWNDSPENNVATFTSAFPNTGYKSLRDMIDQQVSGCANTRTDMPPVDVSGLTVMKWQNDEEHKGFIDSHHGRCETWIDDVMVDEQDDCVATYGSGYPANVKVDFSKCSGECVLRFYWLAIHEPNWQIYKQCVLITNNSGSQTQTEVQGTVKPADTKSEAQGTEEPYGTQPQTQAPGTEEPYGTQPQTQAPGTMTPDGTQPQSQGQDTGSPYGTQPQTQAQGNVTPDGTKSEMQSHSQAHDTVSFDGLKTEVQSQSPVQATATSANSNGCQNRSLRTVKNAPTHLANGIKINWADRRFLRAFNEFAASFERNN